MKLYKTEAIVLRARDCGEADKLLVLYSREYGKIKAMAYGVCKPASRKRGAAQPFCHSRFLLHRGRELDSVSQCEGLEAFPALRADLKKIGYASYMVELVDALTPEGEPCEPLFLLFLTTLHLLTGNDAELLTRAFEIRAACFAGYRPQLEVCVRCCGPLQGYLRFSPGLGGVLCEDCWPADPGALPCNKGIVEMLKLFLRWHPARLSLLQVNKPARNQLKELMRKFLTYHLEWRLKAIDFLDKLSAVDP